ncbi:MAG: hypothetical protein KBC11_01090 [Candidatus Pacebacteria bacterium]|nr:hypothetical protein [Candidatus Paceibacterota bacterium]
MFKKLITISTLVLSLSFLFSLNVNAQQIPTCDLNTPVTSQNFPLCCPSQIPGQIQKCALFCINNPTEIACNPNIRGGGPTTPGTNPTNTGTTPGTIANTPQPKSSELSSCNVIAFDSLLDILIWLKCIIGSAIIPLIFTLAFLYFLWGMVQYIRNANNEKKREESKKFIYVGIIALTVMVSVWGIVRIVTSTFGLGNTVPQLQTDCLTNTKENPCKK